MKKKITLLALAYFMLLCGCSSISSALANNDIESWGSFNLKDTYNVNDSLYLGDVSLFVGGESALAEANLTFPSGKTTDATSNILNESGKYTVTYSTVINGKYYEKSQDFFVQTPYVSHGSSSATYYGVGDKATHAGLNVKLAKNDELTFNEIIDMTDLTKNEALIKLYMTPTTHGSYDVGSLIFKFTDVEDDTNYLEITIGKRAWKPESYPGDCTVFVKGDDSDRVSVESWNGDVPNGGGSAKGYVKANDVYGAMMKMTMNGLRTIDSNINYGERSDGSYGWVSTDTAIISNADYDATEGIITYDYNNMELGIINMKMDFKGSRITETEYKKVWDFDDTKLTSLVTGGYGSWRGFTSGKCRLSIRGDQYESNYASFVLTALHGLDLTSEVLNDSQGPEITISSTLDDNDTLLINGKAGCYYKIPEASANDIYYGKTNVTSEVYLHYGTDKQINVDTVEGRFYPRVAGTYTIVYRSSDNNGNTTIKPIKVIIDESTPSDIKVKLEEDIITSIKQGQYYYLPNVLTSGGKGDKEIKSYYIFNNKKVEITNGSFIPEEAGNYIIRIECTDFIGQTGYLAYNLVVLENDEPFILDEPVLAEYYIAGGQYQIPNLTCFQYKNNNKNSITPTAKVKYKIIDDLGDIKEVCYDLNVGDTFSTVNILDNDTLNISYYYDGILLGTYQAKTINPLYYSADIYNTAIDFKKYFVSNTIKNITYDLIDASVGYKLISSGSDMDFTFANKLLADQLYFSFNAQKQSDLKTIKATLWDANNKNNSFTLIMSTNADGTFDVTCGEYKATTRSVGMNEAINYISVGFDGEKFNIGDNDTIVPVTKFDNGQDFTSISSHLVYAKFEFIGVSNDQYIGVKKIGNHEFETYMDFYGNALEPMSDYVEPQIYIEGDMGKYGQINEKASTDMVIAQDVFAPTSMTLVSVYKTKGNYMDDINGQAINELDALNRYTFIFSTTDVYMAKYVSHELSEYQTYWPTENNKSIEYNYGVIDTVKPIITLTSIMHTSTRVSATLALTTFKVSDNISSEENITVLRQMILPSGRFENIEDNITRYKFNESGVYEFRIIAIDEALNVSIYSTYITVY